MAPHHYWKDDDGDDLVTVTGKVSLKWYDAENIDVTGSVKENPKRRLAGCNAPYKLTIEATEGIIQTKYGIPDLSNFTGASHSFYFYPKVEEPVVCYIKPPLELGTGVYAGSETEWDPRRGFKVQSLDTAGLNFPTTGADNLFFDLKLSGISANKLIEINGNNVSPVEGNGVTIALSVVNDRVVRVTLKGPNDSSPDKRFSPSTFRLYSDKSKKLIYHFKINRWFITRQEIREYNQSVSLCQSYSNKYRLPYLKDLSNADRYNRTNYYKRHISRWDSRNGWDSGLFNEWGQIYKINTSWKEGGEYWTQSICPTKYGDQTPCNVSSADGNVDNVWLYRSNLRAVCVSD